MTSILTEGSMLVGANSYTDLQNFTDCHLNYKSLIMND
jgi:hypothetical protein